MNLKPASSQQEGEIECQVGPKSSGTHLNELKLKLSIKNFFFGLFFGPSAMQTGRNIYDLELLGSDSLPVIARSLQEINLTTVNGGTWEVGKPSSILAETTYSLQDDIQFSYPLRIGKHLLCFLFILNLNYLEEQISAVKNFLTVCKEVCDHKNETVNITSSDCYVTGSKELCKAIGVGPNLLQFRFILDQKTRYKDQRIQSLTTPTLFKKSEITE